LLSVCNICLIRALQQSRRLQSQCSGLLCPLSSFLLSFCLSLCFSVSFSFCLHAFVFVFVSVSVSVGLSVYRASVVPAVVVFPTAKTRPEAETAASSESRRRSWRSLSSSRSASVLLDCCWTTLRRTETKFAWMLDYEVIRGLLKALFAYKRDPHSWKNADETFWAGKQVDPVCFKTLE